MFKSKNLEFRRIDPASDDLSKYLSWMRDPISNPFILGTDTKMTMDSLIDYVIKKNSSENCELWGIFLQKNSNHIGNIKFEPIDFDLKFSWVGILIGDQDYRGQGYGSEALHESMSFFVTKFYIHNFHLGVDIQNQGAIAMYKKLGFSFNPEMSLLHSKHIMSKVHKIIE